ncbi:uncharacterized protein BDZ99DRAFT_39251 [Mytilinidion resinicola]|uniref:Uncharacterized protein n=1 Tax=Mytilinidion resinicola TaxID=574789 RepID=A0A6A6YLM2_9PEZI|nr:uncharacterized protein BDZ99DRAFT_39251 [Mytilinidion resinicola]KAF2808767.1 hypothetical protein BDZ99DRAFT_39251 [Mytilinidion resinicola]
MPLESQTLFYQSLSISLVIVFLSPHPRDSMLLLTNHIAVFLLCVNVVLGNPVYILPKGTPTTNYGQLPTGSALFSSFTGVRPSRTTTALVGMFTSDIEPCLPRSSELTSSTPTVAISTLRMTLTTPKLETAATSSFSGNSSIFCGTGMATYGTGIAPLCTATAPSGPRTASLRTETASFPPIIAPVAYSRALGPTNPTAVQDRQHLAHRLQRSAFSWAT